MQKDDDDDECFKMMQALLLHDHESCCLDHLNGSHCRPYISDDEQLQYSTVPAGGIAFQTHDATTNITAVNNRSASVVTACRRCLFDRRRINHDDAPN